MANKHMKRCSPSLIISLVQLSSVAQSCPTLCDPMDCSTSGSSVHHSIWEFSHIHVHWVSDAIQPCHSLLPPSPFALNGSQHSIFPQLTTPLLKDYLQQFLLPSTSRKTLQGVPKGKKHTLRNFPSSSDGKESACSNSCSSIPEK